MSEEATGRLIPLFPAEEAFFDLKERWQRRVVAWFGLATGLSLSFKFSLVYYEFVAARSLVPGAADSEYFDLEFTALLGIVIGILLAVIPVIIAFRLGKRRPEAYVGVKIRGARFGRWFLGIATIILAVAIMVIGVGSLFATKQFGWLIGFEGSEWITLFGSMLLATPLLIEGIWTLYTCRKGIKKILVLRKGKWSNV